MPPTSMAANASVQLNVLKATPQINWSNPANIVYGHAARQHAAQCHGVI